MMYFLRSAVDGGSTGEVVQGAADPIQQPDATAPEQTPAKDPEKAFAARLGHERKKIESEYTPYKAVLERQAKAAGMEVKEYLDYVKNQQDQDELEAEAERTGKTPEQLKVEKDKADLEAKLQEVERTKRLTEEEKTLMADPKIGEFVKDNLAEIKEIAESAGVNLQVGLALVAARLLPDLIENSKPEKHIKAYVESLKSGAKPVEIGGGATPPGSTPPKTFEEARKAAMELLKSK